MQHPRAQREAIRSRCSARTPLAATAQSARDASGASTRKAFDVIERSALAASALVGDLLTLARDPLPLLLSREPVDIASIASECRDDLVVIAAEREVALSIETKSAIVDGDARRLKELLRNLADNAIKHARTKVCISTKMEIFERFFRIDQNTEGTGLGLTIVRWIAQAHDGFVTVRSDESGTSFIVTLPSVG